ncbi:MAG: DUF1552 domain-containing protein [Vicinamibacterales bacterium]
MIVTKRHLPRRTVLRGAGAAIALPLLDAMVPAFSPLRLSAAAPIRRFGAIYVGMGFNMPIWAQPNPNGPLEINAILQPMDAYRDRLLVVSGCDSKEGDGIDGGQHPRMQTSWLTGSRAFRTEGVNIHAGTSLDQVVARKWEKDTQLASMELAIESTDLLGTCSLGYSCAYNNTIAWRTPTTPLPMENNPRNVFERLFGASDSTEPKVRLAEIRTDRSVLDSVTAKVASVKPTLGARDQSKLAEYLDAVRDVERRVLKAEEQVARELPVVDRPVGIPGTFEEHVKLMFDLQALAFQTDLTRVFTFLMVREASVRSYPEVGVPDSHHPLSHHQNNPEKLARQAKLNAFQMRMLAYFVDSLAKTQEGDGNMLDNTVLFYGSGMSDSNLHLHKNLPITVVHGKNMGITGNRHLLAKEGTPLSNLQMTLLGKMGIGVEKFGDSRGELDLLTGV